MKQAAALLIAIAALAAPASALAAPQLAAPFPTVRVSTPATGTTASPANTTPDRKALNAYASYLATLLQGAPTAQAGNTTYIGTISSPNGCKSALAPLTQPSDQVNTEVQHTLTVLGEEMGDDLSITFDQAAMPTFAKFSNTILHLHWTRLSGALFVVKHYVNTETAVLETLPSELCQDAALAGTEPNKVPDGTKVFLKNYDKASTLANLALANLLRMMQSYEVPNEKSLIAHITTLANQVAAVTKSDLLQSGSALLSSLETT
jgi:hypothetical protein